MEQVKRKVAVQAIMHEDRPAASTAIHSALAIDENERLFIHTWEGWRLADQKWLVNGSPLEHWRLRGLEGRKVTRGKLFIEVICG